MLSFLAITIIEDDEFTAASKVWSELSVFTICFLYDPQKEK